MCTATWVFNQKGYELFFNRDELLTRDQGEPPKKSILGGISILAPIDGDAGGTWIGVNEFGFAVCLLNYYSSKTSGGAGGYISRGLLLHSLLDCPNRETARDRIAAIDLQTYRPFTILLFETATSSPFGIRWSGSGALEFDWAPSEPQSSSSFDTSKVVQGRVRLFHESFEGTDSTAHQHYHRSHEPDSGPYSVCMHRDDAETQSLSHIEVTDRKIEFTYTPGSPCCTRSLPRFSLPLRK
jgi:hypothetical protein